tara:strand:- start:20521 stop:20940 length:420 start_codon:yes stop_codon:yes gene_type:complete
MWDEIDRLHQSNFASVKGHPPYDIIKVSDTEYVIEMAVAGFGEKDMEILLQEDTLTVSGKVIPDKNTDLKAKLHQGIARRNFERKFTLAPDMEVRDVKLADGMLQISLERIIPEEKKPRKLAINSAPGVQSDKQMLTED